MLRKIPDMLESFVDKAADLLNDRNHGVLLSGLQRSWRLLLLLGRAVAACKRGQRMA